MEWIDFVIGFGSGVALTIATIVLAGMHDMHGNEE